MNDPLDDLVVDDSSASTDVDESADVDEPGDVDATDDSDVGDGEDDGGGQDDEDGETGVAPDSTEGSTSGDVVGELPSESCGEPDVAEPETTTPETPEMDPASDSSAMDVPERGPDTSALTAAQRREMLAWFTERLYQMPVETESTTADAEL